MSIYTRRGDAGTTSLVGSDRVSKTCARVEAYGTVDEANSAVGLARQAVADPALAEVLRFVQQRLFNCSSALATPAAAVSDRTPVITTDDVLFLENAIDYLESLCGSSSAFLLEGACEASARLHVARTVVRRAERRIVALAAEEPVADTLLAFVNRLSDLLYAAARLADLQAETAADVWDPAANAPDFPARS